MQTGVPESPHFPTEENARDGDHIRSPVALDLEIAATRELAESSLRLMRDATAMECTSIVRAYKERHCKMPCMGWCACADLLELIYRRYPGSAG